jgi:hypothetical protein
MALSLQAIALVPVVPGAKSLQLWLMVLSLQATALVRLLLTAPVAAA